MSNPWDNPSLFGNKVELDAAMERLKQESDNGDEARGVSSVPEPDGIAAEPIVEEEAVDETPHLNYAPDARIVGMTPAPGWEMIYLDENGEEATARLVAWAMTDEGVVRGLIVAATGEIVFGDTVQDFRGYNDRGGSADIASAIENLNTTFVNMAGLAQQGGYPGPRT